MIDLTYISDNGREFALVAERMYLKTASFHEYKWTPETVKYKYGDLVKLFTKDAQQYSATLAFSGSQSVREANIEAIHDAWEHDIMSGKAGRLRWNGYEIECYFLESKTYANDSNTRTLDDIVIYCPFPFWLKEHKFEINATMDGETVDGLDFDFDFDFDLGVGGYKEIIPFDTTLPLEFRLEINGLVTNPSIYINEHLYEVDLTVPENGKLIINSVEKNDREKGVVLKYPSGAESSALYARNRDSYIFEPIKAVEGNIYVTVMQEMNFDLYIIEKRSEPKWT